jgi:23S rRNA (guanine745-N1)-methyltransferase
VTNRVSRSAALAAVAGRLRCPHCGAGLRLGDQALSCAGGHTYDVSRQGHVSLPAPGRRPAAGDSPEMVAARAAFLGAGHYAPIVARVSAVARARVDRAGRETGCVVDLGAGTGHYLAAVLAALADRSDGADAAGGVDGAGMGDGAGAGDGAGRLASGWQGLGLDSSRAALRRALQADRRIAGVVCDAWGPLPVRDEAADLVLSVFAPRNAPEIARILSLGGTLVVVTPTPQHLQELVAGVGMIGVDRDKPARLSSQLSAELRPGSSEAVEFVVTLDHDAIRAVVGMGPSAHHVDPAGLHERVSRLPERMSVTVGVIVATYARPQATSSTRLPQGSSA